MFKLQSEPTFWAAVEVSKPGKDRPERLDMEFKWLERDKLKDFLLSLEGRDDEEVISEIVVGWRGVDAEFSRENLATLLRNYPQSPVAIFTTFRAEMLHAKTKN